MLDIFVDKEEEIRTGFGYCKNAECLYLRTFTKGGQTTKGIRCNIKTWVCV